VENTNHSFSKFADYLLKQQPIITRDYHQDSNRPISSGTHFTKHQTWRIRNIPLSMQKDELTTCLEDLSCGSPKIHEYNILQLSLSVHHPDDHCATVTFRATPISLQEPHCHVDITHNGKVIRLLCDTKFEGVTTLYHPQTPLVEYVLILKQKQK
jgi:hypothetical protein